MTIFNDLELNVVRNVVREDGQVKIIFKEGTLGISSTSDGYTVTPDWNTRRFTLAFSEGSALYHLTEESKGEKQYNEEDVPVESFIADVYTAVRGIGHLSPIERIVDTLEEKGLKTGVVEVESIREYLKDKRIIEETDAGIEVNPERREKFISGYSKDRELRKEAVSQSIKYLPADEIPESEEEIFVIADDEYRLYVLFLFPDGYASVIPMEELLTSIFQMSGSMTLDMLFRALLD